MTSALLLRLVLISVCAPVAATHLHAGQERTYDIRHYDLLIDPDFAARTMRLVCTVSIDNPQRDSVFEFGLASYYRDVSVRTGRSPARFHRTDGWITVTVEEPGEETSLEFVLEGPPGTSNDENRAVLEDSSFFLLWSDRFYPIDFGDWATVRTIIRVPEGFEVIAPGRETSVRSISNGRVGITFETRNPTVCFSVFGDARWIRSERVIEGLRMQTFLHPQSTRFADQIFSMSSAVIRFFSDLYSPYAFDLFSFITLEGIFARRAFPGFVGYSPRYLEREMTTTGHDAHETSILWWGYTLRGSGPGSFQWTEGFGDYAEFLFGEAFGKPVPAIFLRFRSQYLALKSDEDVHYTELRGNTPQEIVHGKYPWLMHMLRYVVGESAFRNAMRLLFDRFRFRTFTMDEFVQALEEGCGQTLRWWREEWVERKGVPEVAMSWSTEAREGGHIVTVTLEQTGNLYTLPLEIAIETENGRQKENIVLDRRTVTFRFESGSQPSNVILDPDEWILMRKAKREAAEGDL